MVFAESMQSGTAHSASVRKRAGAFLFSDKPVALCLTMENHSGSLSDCRLAAYKNLLPVPISTPPARRRVLHEYNTEWYRV